MSRGSEHGIRIVEKEKGWKRCIANENWTMIDKFPAGSHSAALIEEGKKTVRFSRTR